MKPLGATLCLAALAALIYWSVFNLRPFEGDNLYILAWAERARGADLISVDPDIYPEWRPLPFVTIWLQYQSAGLQSLWQYSLVNLALWLVCGWFVMQIVRERSGSMAAGFFAALLMLSSTQLLASVVLIVERQSSMACVFGLAAWLLIVRDRDRKPASLTAIFVLLLASLLSKEYGLAFAAAFAVYAIAEHRRPLVVASSASVAVYVLMRTWITGGWGTRGLTSYCEEHGYFFGLRNVCFDRLDAVTISQSLYNVAATTLNSFWPGFFFDDGAIDLSPRWLVFSALFLVLATTTWVTGSGKDRISLFAVLFNSALSILLYRSRNQAIAVCAMSIATGTALPQVWKMVQVRPQTVRFVVLVAMLGILATRVTVSRQLAADRVRMTSAPDPCGPDIPDLDPAFMRRLWQQYNLVFPGC